MLLLSTGVSTCTMNKCSNPSLTANLHQKPILKIAPFSLNPTPIHNRTLTPTKICALTQESSTSTDAKIERKEKLTVEVKPMEKPRLVLKFIWMEKNIGIAIDQVIPGGHGTIPLSPYYFWPRKDAWEELKVLLEGKKWISQKQMVLLLNQATDIINLWQQSGGDSA